MWAPTLPKPAKAGTEGVCLREHPATSPWLSPHPVPAPKHKGTPMGEQEPATDQRPLPDYRDYLEIAQDSDRDDPFRTWGPTRTPEDETVTRH